MAKCFAMSDLSNGNIQPELKQGKPPNYAAIVKAFPAVASMPNVVFTYGNTVYVSHGTERLEHALLVHEATHVRQQRETAGGPEAWWKMYLASEEFRMLQEIEAYHAQYVSMSRPDRDKHIRRLASDLCSPMYGSIITFDEAKRAIRLGLGYPV